jgi:uncharacterized RmlC-like cupin family protein
MSSHKDMAYLRALGARVLAEANDLKRTPEALATELGIDLGRVQAVIEGRADRDVAEHVVLAMVAHYPISLADLWLEPDDTDDGAVICRANQSLASARVFERRNAYGVDTPYYEYRDTAMSRTAGFKPEWIQPLRVVHDADPDNPDVAYNKGHLLHQITFFIGAVNFYWRVGGRSHCAEMKTGDSNFITPFVPHSFTSRDPKQPGLIIAVTYAGNVRRAIGQLGQLSPQALEELAGNPESALSAFTTRLRRYLAAESLSAAELSDRLVAAGMMAGRAEDLTSGRSAPDSRELAQIADQLSVLPVDLMGSSVENDTAVALQYAGYGARFFPPKQPVVRLSELARTRRQSALKGFAVDVIADGRATPFQHGLHQYLYVYGDEPVRVFWGGSRDATLAPGDSMYVRPMVPHWFAPASPKHEGRVAIIRTPGALSDAVLDEYSSFASGGRQRVIEETTRWF